MIFLFAMLLSQLSTAQIEERMLFGMLARQDLTVFCQVTSPRQFESLDVRDSAYEVRPHHRLIASAMERVKAGKLKRLIIVVPPSHGKTELVIRKSIPFIWGDQPTAKFLVLTYGASLAADHGRDVRKLMLSNEYKLPFGNSKAMLSQDSRAMDYLETEAGGKAWFDSLTGSVTGKHANYIFIDDPIKGTEEARSPTTRDNVWENLQSVVFTRRQNVETAIVLVTTRWNLDDPAARLIDKNNPHCSHPEDWEVIHIRGCIMTQAEADADPLKRKIGEALWPEKMSFADYERMRTGDYFKRATFQTLYQGDPAPITGSYFQTDWIQGYGEGQLPKQLKNYVGSDHAVRTDQQNDATCIIPAGYDENGDLWVYPDVWWEHKTTDIVVDAMLDKMRIHRPIFWFAGRDQITGSIKPFLQRRQREENVFCALLEMSDIKDKETKAQPLQGLMAQKRVHFPVWMPWWPAAHKELMAFAKEGVPNDFVDALANIVRGIHLSPQADGAKPDSTPKPGTFAWHNFGRSDKTPKGLS